MNLGSMMITALNSPQESDKALTADQKVHRAVLSQKVHNALAGEDGNIDVTQEEIVMCKELINVFYAPLPLMRAFDIFDPKVEEVAKAE